MSASGRDGFGLIAAASDRWNSISAAAQGGIMGVIAATFALLIDVGQAIADVFIIPTSELATQGGNVVEAFTGGIAAIIRQGAVTTVASIAPGATWAVGPLSFAFSVLAAGGGLYVMAAVLSRGFTSDTIPGTFTDIPFIGVDEEDEEADE